MMKKTISLPITLILTLWLSMAAQASNLEATAEHLMIQNILKSAGVLELIQQMPGWVEQEMSNLQATPVPFDGKELQAVRKDLEISFSAPSMKDKLVAKLSDQFTLEELRAIYSLFKKPDVKRFQDLQDGTENDYIKADIRSYKAKLKSTNPRGSRVEMVKTLDENLHQSKMEVDLKVELRKSLLTSVSWLKSNEILDEGVLEKELSGYRQRVGEEINRNALIFYLYLFKRTPSDQLNNLVSSFDQPNYNKFMAICHQVMLTSIKEARRQIPEDINLAEN